MSYNTTDPLLQTHYTFACNGISNGAVRYSVANDSSKAVAFGTDPNSANFEKWFDTGSDYPGYFATSSSGPWSTSVADAATVYMAVDSAGQSGTGSFSSPQFGYSSGPTVTSITVASEISSTRQFTVTHTGTLTASDISYKINGVDITSLGSPNTPITNLQTTSTGSTFDSYTLSSNGYHIINIGNQYLEFYKSSNFLAQTTFPELNNAGLSISFPNTSALWLAKASGFDSVTLYNDGAQYKGTTLFNNYDRVEYLWVGTKYYSNTDPSLRGFKRYEISYIDESQTWLQGTVYYIDPVARYESTGLLTTSFSSVTNNFYNTYLFDFVSLTAQTPTTPDETEQAPTTSNEGGKRRRYPIISTNLFDRQKSIFSIGMTHKDETLF